MKNNPNNVFSLGVLVGLLIPFIIIAGATILVEINNVYVPNRVLQNLCEWNYGNDAVWVNDFSNDTIHCKSIMPEPMLRPITKIK